MQSKETELCSLNMDLKATPASRITVKTMEKLREMIFIFGAI